MYILICLFVTLISRFISVKGWMTLIEKGIVVAGITAVLEFSIYYKTEGIVLLRKRIRGVLSNSFRH